MIVGVHIRHGMDISMNSRNRKHGHVDTPIEYYRRAIEQIQNVYESVKHTVDLCVRETNRLRELSPLWEMVQEGIDLKSIQWTQH
uniref:L-Fucosyltransferase n=1 Tax=Caenorhabditis japonica TaxID=281687 RepID=A0A8R1I675_CAEJA